jgi:hypothetical protein
MATEPTLDVSRILAASLPSPLRDSDPERDLVWNAFQRALGGAVSVPPGPKDLDELIRLGDQCLSMSTRHLGIAALMVDALTLRAGFAGLRDGLTLVCGLITHRWNECFPWLGPGGDAERRARSLATLTSERALLRWLRLIGLSDPEAGAEPICLADVLKRRAGGRGSLPTEADVTSGAVGEAVARSPRAFYERLADDLRGAVKAAEDLEKAVDPSGSPGTGPGPFGPDAPTLAPLIGALSDCTHVLNMILTLKGRDDQGPIPEPTPRSQAVHRAPVPEVAGGTGDDFGRALIAFHDRARALADDAERLKKNREEYATLVEQIKVLDAEYAEVSARVARDPDLHRLLTGRPAPPTGRLAEPEGTGTSGPDAAEDR